MQLIVLAAAAALAVYTFARWSRQASPARRTQALRWIALILGGALAVFLLARGANALAASLPLLLPLADRLRYLLTAFGQLQGAMGGHRPAGASGSGQSSVRTRFLDMELDHATGQLHGEVLEGRFRGRRLGELTLAELATLWRECRQDQQSQAVLESYLDRYQPNWREQAAGDSGAQGPGNAGMSAEEACATLGIRPGASPEEIRTAHRRLMQRVHPDHGGSDVLAARVNEAKRVLLGE